MKTDQINLRLEVDLVAAVERAASEEGIDRATMFRKLLHDAIAARRLDRALASYQRNEVSPGRASEEAGISHWDFLEIVRQRGMAYPLTPEIADARLGTARRNAPRVAESAPSYRSSREESNERTLPDRPPRPGGVLLIGINPAPRSVAAGHYYQGRLGRRLWQRLSRVGLLDRAAPGREDDAFVAAGNGLTDVAKRPTRSARELTRDELAEGAQGLESKVKSWRPRLVVFAFAGAARASLRRRIVAPGDCGTLGGVPAFLLTGPYASRNLTRQNDGELMKLLKDGA